MAIAKKALMAIGIFGVALACLVGLAMFMMLIVLGGPHLASYLAGLFGLGVLVEFIITVAIFMALPAVMITFTKIKY